MTEKQEEPMTKFFIRILVYGSIPLRFLWALIAEQKLAFKLAMTEVRYPEDEVRHTLEIVRRRRAERNK